MTTATTAAAVLLGLAACWICHRVIVARRLREHRATWRAHLSRGLMDASAATAQTSEAAAAALKLVAEAIQGTGELGYLESNVLAERVAEGAGLDARNALAPSIARVGVMLHQIAAARELLHVMEPSRQRETTLRQDAIQHLDHASQAYLGRPLTK
jgi:hypothetical protein